MTELVGYFMRRGWERRVREAIDFVSSIIHHSYITLYTTIYPENHHVVWPFIIDDLDHTSIPKSSSSFLPLRLGMLGLGNY